MGERGVLRIYLGVAPGAGTTYAMLSEATRRVERGTDVVVGIVETHARARTEELLEGLEQVPRCESGRPGGRPELDVDAVLARRPEVVLVDEFAHTNAAGSCRSKRWQDVEELLEAGITVLSTVNVQHLASLTDVIERVTGVRQRETVPDEVVRRAEQVELVDITPEALRRRMAHGNVHRAEDVDAALASCFRPGNLLAVRELALLWLADQCEIALRRYRADARVTDVWETRERVVVGLTGGAESGSVLRRAARIAERSRSAELMAVHVVRGEGSADPSVAVLAGLRRLAGEVGASLHLVVGEDVPPALLDFARGVNATQLVLGTSRRSRLVRVVAAGVVARVVRHSGPIDVHLVTHDEAGSGVRLPRRSGAIPLVRRAVGWGLGVLLPLVATAAGVLGRDVVDLSTGVVLYFLTVVVVALVGGLGPALLAALAAGSLLNFFFTAPLYTLTIAGRENLLTVSAMVVVAVLVALVVDRAARRAAQAAAASAEAALLATFTRTVLTAPDPLPQLLEGVQQAFGLTAVALLERRGGRWVSSACVGPADCDHPDRADIDVVVEPGVHLVGRGRTLAAADRRLLETVGGQALLALRHQKVSADAVEARRRAEVTELRTTLLAAIGHDLRTPLTSIKAAAGSLRDPDLPLTDVDRAELAATVEESADRLTAVVANLLDSSRLATGAVVPELRAVAYDELAAQTLAGVEGAGRVRVEIDEQLPEVLADPGLLDRVLANVVDNALRHGGGAPVALRASAHADRVELRVVDSGPGVGSDDVELLFAPFQRPGDRGGGGLGLGLSVARGFTEAMGGTLNAEDTPGSGLTVVIDLPAAARPAWTAA